MVYRLVLGANGLVRVKWVERIEPQHPDLSPAVSRAVLFLQTLFAETPVIPSKEVRAALNAAGLTQHTVEAAVVYLKLKIVKSSIPSGPWLWMARENVYLREQWEQAELHKRALSTRLE